MEYYNIPICLLSKQPIFFPCMFLLFGIINKAARLLYERVRSSGRHKNVEEQGQLPDYGRLCQALRG